MTCAFFLDEYPQSCFNVSPLCLQYKITKLWLKMHLKNAMTLAHGGSYCRQTGLSSKRHCSLDTAGEQTGNGHSLWDHAAEASLLSGNTVKRWTALSPIRSMTQEAEERRNCRTERQCWAMVSWQVGQNLWVEDLSLKIPAVTGTSCSVRIKSVRIFPFLTVWQFLLFTYWIKWKGACKTRQTYYLCILPSWNYTSVGAIGLSDSPLSFNFFY